MARRLVTRDEVPNHKLATLARYFSVPVTPNHRALEDARATVSVFHALLDRFVSLGATHLDDLRHVVEPVPPARRQKAHLARDLPQSPGSYISEDSTRL